MANVCIKPLPAAYRKIKPLYRPHFPPIFSGDLPASPEDIQLARELFSLLDDESKNWYRRTCSSLFEGLE